MGHLWDIYGTSRTGLDLKDKKIIRFKGSLKTGYYVLDGTINGTINKKE